MAVVNKETLRRLLGDFPEEPLDGAYRVGATVLVKNLRVKALKELGGRNARGGGHFAAELLRSDMGEAILGFLLAAALEFLPLSQMPDVRAKFAYNLRVRSWEELEKSALPVLGRMLEDVEVVMKNLPDGGDKRPAA